jgi:competence ComEA-like helix-hairpin-helix protein
MKIELILLLSLLCFILPASVNAECSNSQININTASLSDLDKITYVGSATAQNIINKRPFLSLDDLLNVSGIGDVKLNAIKSQGLACVSNKTNEDKQDNLTIETEEIKNKSEENNEKIVKKQDKLVENNLQKEYSEENKLENSNTESIIKLNSDENFVQEIYSSRNEKIKENLLLGFCIFLILIIILLLIRR